jgi:hypothetical protein
MRNIVNEDGDVECLSPRRHFAALLSLALWGHSGPRPDLPLAQPGHE